MSDTQVTITPVPIIGTIGCCVPVVPGTPDVEAPREERTEFCAVDANWIVGAVPTCDTHLKFLCGEVEWDWPGVVAESGRSQDSADRPWADRQRHSQEDTQKHYDHFMPA